MNKNFFTILLTVAISSAAIIGVTYAFKNDIFSTGSPEMAAEKFYASWIAYQGNPLVDKYYEQSPLVTADFSVRVDEIVSSFQGGAYDPVLCAQDKPEGFRADKAVVKGDVAKVSVVENFGNSEKTALVNMKKIDGKWKVNSIDCNANGEENTASLPETEIQNKVGDFIRENISTLSPEKAVLGGTWYVTSIEFTSNDNCVVSYEDGHIALEADVRFTLAGDKVDISSFKISEDSEEQGGNKKGFCEDTCGNGTCEEMVCMAEGCPCVETLETCSIDCK